MSHTRLNWTVHIAFLFFLNSSKENPLENSEWSWWMRGKEMKGMLVQLVLLGSEVTGNSKRMFQGLSNFRALSLFYSKYLCAFVHPKMLKIPKSSLTPCISSCNHLRNSRDWVFRRKISEEWKPDPEHQLAVLFSLDIESHRLSPLLPKKTMHFKDNITNDIMQNHLLI